MCTNILKDKMQISTNLRTESEQADIVLDNLVSSRQYTGNEDAIRYLKAVLSIDEFRAKSYVVSWLRKK